MKKLFPLLLLLIGPPTWALVPIDTASLHAAMAVSNNIIVQRMVTTMPDGTKQDSLAVAWAISKVNSDGSITINNHCSITLASEFLTNATGRSYMLSLLLVMETPSGVMWSWNAAGPAPAGINPWCTSQ